MRSTSSTTTSKRPVQNLVDTSLRLLRMGAHSNLKNLLERSHPADAAEVILRLNRAAQLHIIELLSSSPKLPLIFLKLGSEFLLKYVEEKQNISFVAERFQSLPSDDVAELVSLWPEEIAQDLLNRLKSEKSSQVEELLQYEESTAGSLMSQDVLKIHEGAVVSEAIALLQDKEQAATVFYVYVVDTDNHLVGVLSIRQLFQVERQTPVSSIMLRDVVRTKVDEAQEEVANLVAQYDIVAIPVVDHENHLLGVITVDDVIDVIQEEAQEDLLQVVSASGEEVDGFDFTTILKKRIPWVFFMALGGIISMEITIRASQTVPGWALFAGFIPLLLRMGGFVSLRSSTLAIQELKSSSVNLKTFLTLLKQQGLMALTLSLLLILFISCYIMMRFHRQALLGAAVGISLLSTMALSVLMGITLPLIFDRLRLDPTIARGALVSFIFDIMGLIVYFQVICAFFERLQTGY